MLVPKFGYIAAAWTTLISYIAALFLHAFMVKKTDYSFAINTKMQMLLGLVSLILIPFSSILYTNLVIRIIFVLVTSIVSLVIVLRIWKKIKGNV